MGAQAEYFRQNNTKIMLHILEFGLNNKNLKCKHEAHEVLTKQTFKSIILSLICFFFQNLPKMG